MVAYINLLPQALRIPSLASSSLQKIFLDSRSAVSFMASSSASLSSLPAELLLSILRYSRELSFINVCREFRDCLPPFAPLARSLAVLAFSQVSQVQRPSDGQNPGQKLEFQGPVTEFFLRPFHSVLDEGMICSFPLSLEDRARLQHDILCSGWWNINRFHAVHLFLFRLHLLSLRDRLVEDSFLTSVDQMQSLAKYVRQFESHWSLWTAPRKEGTVVEDLPLILPWKSMPTYFVSTRLQLPIEEAYPGPFDYLTEEACDITLSQHAFVFRRGWHGQECWNIMRVNDSEPKDVSSRVFFGEYQDGERLENVRVDKKHRQYFLPPRPLLTPPFTARKQGILVYLVQEAAGCCFITDKPDLNQNSTRADDERILHRAILEAIPQGDLPFLKILLIMLQGQSPPHLSPDQSYTGALVAPVPGSQDRAMVQLYVEKASWSQDNMDEYVVTAMRAASPEALSILLDIYAGYDKRLDDVHRFEERMARLLGQSQLGEDDGSQARIRDVVVRKVKSLKAAVRNSYYTRDKWVAESEVDTAT